jgi:transcriptional antiterminator
MAYLEIDVDDIDTSVIYVSMKELCKRVGMSRTTINNHINKNRLNGFRYRNRTYFHPDEVERYEAMCKCGLLG